ncbi:MAG TPA: peptidoglycan-binding protein [Bacillota bacterium]|nr:peptidoglycan-binding protein [Bacillota bacterium]
MARFEGALPHVAFGSRTLRPGLVGTDVKVLQVLIGRSGVLPGPAADGGYGPDTAAAVAALRSRYGLPPAGDCDPAVFAVCGQPTTAEGRVFGRRPLRLGAEGEDVRGLQYRLCNHQIFARLLGRVPDGRFDAATQEAVRAFQRVVGAQMDGGVAADGVVGPETANALLAYTGWGGRPLSAERGSGLDALFFTLTLFPHLGWEVRMHDQGGPRLAKAVAEFQRLADLPVDGVAGAATFWQLGLRTPTFPPLINARAG